MKKLLPVLVLSLCMTTVYAQKRIAKAVGKPAIRKAQTVKTNPGNFEPGMRVMLNEVRARIYRLDNRKPGTGGC